VLCLNSRDFDIAEDRISVGLDRRRPLGRVFGVPPPSALVLDQIDGGLSKRQCALWLDRQRIDPVDKKVPCFESLSSCFR
jgi:hypothetical protein